MVTSNVDTAAVGMLGLPNMSMMSVDIWPVSGLKLKSLTWRSQTAAAQ